MKIDLYAVYQIDEGLTDPREVIDANNNPLPIIRALTIDTNGIDEEGYIGCARVSPSAPFAFMRDNPANYLVVYFTKDLKNLFLDLEESDIDIPAYSDLKVSPDKIWSMVSSAQENGTPLSFVDLKINPSKFDSDEMLYGCYVNEILGREVTKIERYFVPKGFKAPNKMNGMKRNVIFPSSTIVPSFKQFVKKI